MNFTLDPTTVLLALAALITAIASFLGQRNTARSLQNEKEKQAELAKQQAKQSDITILREIIDQLQLRVKTLEEDYEAERKEHQKERRNNFALLDYIGKLRSLLIKAGIDVPDMPKLE